MQLFCNNNTAQINDDLNVNIEIDGLSSARSIQNSFLEVKFSARWASAQAFSTPINLTAKLNGSVVSIQTSDTSVNPVSQLITTINYSSLPTGPYTVSAESTNAPGCVSLASFIIQEEPTASTPSFVSKNIPLASNVSTASVSLNASFTVDSTNSLNGNSPNITWKVNGQTFNTNPISVNLPAGSYSAEFTVDDGVFSASDVTQISISDSLSIGSINVESVCDNGQSTLLIIWSGVNDADTYEVDYKEQFYSWNSIINTSNNFYNYEIPYSNRSTDSIRVRACNSNRCGPYRFRTFIDTGCSGGSILN